MMFTGLQWIRLGLSLSLVSVFSFLAAFSSPDVEAQPESIMYKILSSQPTAPTTTTEPTAPTTTEEPTAETGTREGETTTQEPTTEGSTSDGSGQ